jgi:hypothetical protein
MSDEDNIINLPAKEYEQFSNAINGRPERNEVLHELLTGEAGVQLSDGSTLLPITAEGLGFKDMEAAINMRDWLEIALAAKGGKMVGGGFGFGAADLDIELEGHRYAVSIRPIS